MSHNNLPPPVTALNRDQFPEPIPSSGTEHLNASSSGKGRPGSKTLGFTRKTLLVVCVGILLLGALLGGAIGGTVGRHGQPEPSMSQSSAESSSTPISTHPGIILPDSKLAAVRHGNGVFKCTSVFFQATNASLMYTTNCLRKVWSKPRRIMADPDLQLNARPGTYIAAAYQEANNVLWVIYIDKNNTLKSVSATDLQEWEDSGLDLADWKVANLSLSSHKSAPSSQISAWSRVWNSGRDDELLVAFVNDQLQLLLWNQTDGSATTMPDFDYSLAKSTALSVVPGFVDTNLTVAESVWLLALDPSGYLRLSYYDPARVASITDASDRSVESWFSEPAQIYGPSDVGSGLRPLQLPDPASQIFATASKSYTVDSQLVVTLTNLEPNGRITAYYSMDGSMIWMSGANPLSLPGPNLTVTTIAAAFESPERMQRIFTLSKQSIYEFDSNIQHQWDGSWPFVGLVFGH
ncbi:hypothetical protein FGG08_002604 [Glutinoglossum americanum]|uniref:Fucose-specific lectin n=1 Tax=Glutinoglossum americanum TaxID=1670608 RepID=A0A9P8HZY4_9PEZI|nr:hypothetical protein FGG08_002604 [Glutinoglossum americanum]